MLVEAKLDRIQAQAQVRQELKAQDNLIIALNMEEYFWTEKSRIKWHLEGDQNTSFSIVFLKSGILSSLLLFSVIKTSFIRSQRKLLLMPPKPVYC